MTVSEPAPTDQDRAVMTSRARAAWLGVFLIVQMLYFPINRCLQEGVILKTSWDVHFPLRPAWAVPYLLGLAWWAACWAWAAYKMEDDLYQAFIISLTAVNLCSYLIYIFYPTYVERPALPGDGWPLALMRLIYNNDRAYNAFPSGHTYTTVLIYLFWRRWLPRWRWLWAGISAPIVLATLFTRQHNLPDLAGGLTLAVTGYAFGLWAAGRGAPWHRPPHRPSVPMGGQVGPWSAPGAARQGRRAEGEGPGAS